MTQATVVTHTKDHARLPDQASTNLQQTMKIARHVSRASTGLLQDKLLVMTLV